MIKAVLFDMDGVLIDSLEAWFKLFNKTLKHFGREEFTWQHFLDKVWGGPIERDAKLFFGKSVDAIKKFYFDNFDEFKKNLKLFPNVTLVLKKLRKKKIKIALVTNTPKKQTYKLLDYLNLRDCFDIIVCGDEVKHGKPAPDLIIAACKKLKIKPKDSIYIGDANVDIIAGRKAKCFTIGFKIDGDKRIDDLKELLYEINPVKKIIPCLDMKNGRVVKGVKFVNIKDAGDPVEYAKEYIRQGADELVLLDISASLEKRKTMLGVVKKVAAVTTIPFTVGGGIKTIEDIKDVLNAGADNVSINTAAVENPSLIKKATEKFGKKIIVAIDVQKNKKMPSGYEVLIYSGEKATGKDAVKWAKEAVALGAIAILPTSKDRDGTKEGYDLEIIRKIKEAVNIPVIASGGVGNLKHILDGLTKGKADAALAASIFHYGEYTVKDIKNYLKENGIAVRE